MSHLQAHPGLTSPASVRRSARRTSLTLGVYAAFVQAFAAAASLVTAVALIGLAALSDPARLAALAVHNPLPLLLQDSLKFVSAAASIVVIVALFRRLRSAAPTAAGVAAACGLLAVTLLLANAALSLAAVTQARAGLAVDARLSGLVGLLGMAAIAVNGLWYLLVSWTARTAARLPLALCWLGLALGVLSLVPFLALLVLVLSVVWSLWLGLALRQAP
ncbi:MAG: hypothetical protein K1X65_08645 [Caldilineales bacterium]|nr:hypothetical protein [Caldilineales bacterium]MCW5858235.1 hypothetical protein [Caldilineales bacterium]